MHCSIEFRTAIPHPFLAYRPSLVKQDDIVELTHIPDIDGRETDSIYAGHPPKSEELEARSIFETANLIKSF